MTEFTITAGQQAEEPTEQEVKDFLIQSMNHPYEWIVRLSPTFRRLDDLDLDVKLVKALEAIRAVSEHLDTDQPESRFKRIGSALHVYPEDSK